MSTQRAKTVRTKSYKAPSPPVGVIVHPVYAKGTTNLLNRQKEEPPRNVSREGEGRITRSLSTRSTLGNRLSNFIRRSERGKVSLVNGKSDKKTSQELKTKSEFVNTSDTTVNASKNENETKDNCLAGSSRNSESTSSQVRNGNPNCSSTIKGNTLNGGENKRTYQRHITPLKALKYLPVGRFLKLLKPLPERRNSCPGFEASDQESSPKQKDIVEVEAPQWTSELELNPTTVTTEYVTGIVGKDLSKTDNSIENCKDHKNSEGTQKALPIREFCKTSRTDVNTIQILSGQAQKEFEENNVLLLNQKQCINNAHPPDKKTLSPVDEILELSEDEVKSTVVVISENSQLFPKVGKIKTYQNGKNPQSDHRNSDVLIKQSLIETTTNISVQANRENPELISSDISTKGLAVVFITTDDSTIQRIKKHSSAFTYNTNDAKNVGCSIITVLSEPTCSNKKNCSFLDSSNDRGSDTEKNNTLTPYIVDYNNPLTNLNENKICSPELVEEKIKQTSNINKNTEDIGEKNKLAVTDPLNFTNDTEGKNVTLFHVNCSDNDQIPSSNTTSQCEVEYGESNNNFYSNNDKNNHKDNFSTNNHLDISDHFATEISQADSNNRNIIKQEIPSNNEDETAVENNANISEEFQNSQTQNELVSHKKINSNYKQSNEVVIHNSQKKSNNQTDYNNNCKDANTIKLNLTIESEQFYKKSVASTVKDNKTDDNVNEIHEDKTSHICKQEENENQHLRLSSINLKESHVNGNLITHGEYTDHYNNSDKVNNFVNLTTINDELLDFGERLSCTTPSESSTGDITECYNVKLDAPEEFIVAGFHDFCHTMLSLEESSLEPYDTGTIKKRPEKLTTKSENIDNCTLNENKSIQLYNNTENTEISQINCSTIFSHEDTENISISEELENQTDKLFEEIQKSKVMEKMTDVKDDEIMEAIQELDKSLLDVQKAFSENSTNMPQQQDSPNPKPQSNITVQVKSHVRVPKDDKIQCDNLIEELMLEDISKRVLDSSTENIQSNHLGRGIAVTISNRMNHNQIYTSLPPDGDENLYESEISEITTENALDNPKEELIKYEKQSLPQGEMICTITSQPGIECSFNSPSSSMETMSIASTTMEDTKPNNAALEAKEDTVSLPVSFTSEEQNSDPLPSSPLQVSLNNSPMSHSSQDVVACHRTSPCSVDSGTSSHNQGYFVVVAIDFGTTYSGYAFSFTRDPENIHMMKKWDGGDPGVFNQKTPTTLLLTPEGAFHSFGYSARDYYHDLDTEEAKRWLYFDKFKMTLHHSEHLSLNTEIAAANGKSMLAVDIFAHALRYFKDHALQELSDQSATRILNEDVRWVVTVPAIWKQPAKQFMRAAAYNAGIASPEFSDQLLIALEPEAASIYCRRMRLHQLVPDEVQKSSFRWSTDSKDNQDQNGYNDRETPSIPIMQNQHVDSSFSVGTRYMVVDCGGGTVDITVHEILDKHGTLKELQKATGGPYGSMGVDIEFEKLLCDIFGTDFIQQFKAKRPTGFVDLMVAFEARKRNASPYKSNPLNISLPFSFIDYFKKYKGSSVESTIKKSSHKDVKWSQGMLRLEQSAMEKLFYKTVKQIREHIESIVFLPELNIDHLFLVGGFAESLILQKEIKDCFSSKLKVIIPQGVSLAILKGAVLFGLDPTIVNIRRLRMTYGVGVLNRFIHGVHPKEKLVIKDNIQWCADIFDKFVVTDQSVGLGDVVVRSYTPAKAGQSCSVIHIYCSEKDNVYFITDPGVKRCATLILDLSDSRYVQSREIQTRMMFGDTEIKVSALDVTTGKCVKSEINFLSH